MALTAAGAVAKRDAARRTAHYRSSLVTLSSRVAATMLVREPGSNGTPQKA